MFRKIRSVLRVFAGGKKEHNKIEQLKAEKTAII
jgi:hypothetical protein